MIIGLIALLVAVGGFAYWLNVSNKAVAPDVIGKTVAQARTILLRADFDVAATDDRFDETVPAGQVIEQVPRGGERVDKGRGFTLVVSKGPKAVTLTITTNTTDDGTYECETVAKLFAAVYVNSQLVDENGDVIGQISGTWTEAGGNGAYLPCNVTAVFSNVPADRSEYTIELDPERPEENHIGPISRAELENANWTIER